MFEIAAKSDFTSEQTKKVQEEVIELNRKILLILLSLSLAITIGVAAVVPAFAHEDKGDTANGSNVMAYGEHGEVIIQLPTGSPKVTNVTSLRLIAANFNKKSTFGAYDTLVVSLWEPIANAYVPVAQISNVPNLALQTFLHAFYNNTPVWNGLMPNVINVTEKDFKVWMDDDILMANLTTTVKITLPFNLMVGTPYATWGNQTFNLPPITLMFRPIAHGFHWEESATLTKPPLSGYTMTVKSTMNPAWVKVDIPAWVKAVWLEVSGHICTHITQTGIPPAA